MSGKPFYITTPIYYVNDVPHIGHAYTTIAADVLSRWHKSGGDDSYFLTGTDEHGQKIQTVAEKKGITPIELCDEVVQNFERLWKTLNIQNDDFIRTTQPRHEKVVQEVFRRLMASGDIYKGEYEGWYCVPCETYVPEAQMAEGQTCPDCHRPLTKMTEETYFFRLSKYTEPLLKFYEEHPDAIMPKERYNEVVSFIKSGLRDQSISRTTLKWGIPLPGDEKHVIYVWFDALINYISALGFPEPGEKWEKYWPAARHLVGKDIIRFHCVIWPAMLMALGLTPPVRVFAHGWWTVEGEKMSKSLGNVVDPDEIIKKYGADTARLFILFAAPPEKDLDWSERGVEGANRFLGRVWRLVEGSLDQLKAASPERVAMKDITLKEERDMKRVIHSTLDRVTKDIRDERQFNTAVARLMELANALIAYAPADEKGWSVKREGVETLLCCLSPFAPHITEELWHMLGNDSFLSVHKWFEVDETALVEDSVTIVLQINGKVREQFTVPAGLSKEDLLAEVMGREETKKRVEGKEIVKTIAVPGKLVNIVVKG